MRIVILYGTETGNAEMLAEDLAGHLGGGHDTVVKNMASADPSVFDEEAFFVIVSSTYGEGELPSTARPFHAALLARKPDLKHIRFAVFGLGDQTTYADTFAFGSKHWLDTMTTLGAIQVGERAVHDASSADLAEDIAYPWIDGILALCEPA